MGAIPVIISLISAAYSAKQQRDTAKETRRANETNEAYQKRVADTAAAEAAEKKRLLAEERATQEGKLRDLEAKRAKRAQQQLEGSTLKTGLLAWNQGGKQTLGA